MASFLVTGGLGFIGSHIVETLLEQGHGVRVLDDLSTGKRANVPSGIEVIEGDVSNPETTHKAMVGMDGCFHFAAVASVQKSIEDWTGTSRANLSGSVSVFQAAASANEKPIPVVYASSAAVYGNAEELPIHETSATKPLSAYGADKLASELHAKVGGIVHNLPTLGLRMFNVYGPRQDPSSPYSGVVSIFMERIKKSQGLTIYGDGLQERDFIYVKDVAAMAIAAMGKASTVAPVLNICLGKCVTVLELAEALIKLSEKNLPIDFAEARSGEIKKSQGDASAVSSLLDITAHTDLVTGLKDTMEAAV